MDHRTEHDHGHGPGPGTDAAHQGSHAHDGGHAPAAHAPTHDHAQHDHAAHAGHDVSDGGARAGHDMSGHGDHAGHDMSGHGGHGDHVGQFRRLFWVMLVLAVPTVALSPMFAMLLGYDLPDAAWLPWVSPVLGTVIFFWGGRPFLTGAVSELRGRKPGMMTLISLAITVAFVSSLGSSLGLLAHELDVWWELALLVVIMLLGHWLEMRSLAQTASALDSLAALLPDEAERVAEDGSVTTVPPTDLRVGDLVVVRPGGRVPADGEVASGSADVDESMITGESRPVRRTVGDAVVAGTVATDDALRVRITAVGEDTALAGIQRLVADAQASSTKTQRLADRAAGWLFWYALGAAALTIGLWLVFGTPEQALIRAITVLVIACPHALGLAIPLVVSLSTERAAKAGVLVKDRLALERMRTVDTVLFDKTGTLTAGEPVVAHLATAGGTTEDELLALAAAAEADSQHPLARAIVRAAEERSGRGLVVPQATGFRSLTAVGVEATVPTPDGARRVAVGGPALLRERGLDPLPDAEAWAHDGATVLHVVVSPDVAGADADARHEHGHEHATDEVVGAFALADAIRPKSREAVDALHRRGIKVVMITGDAEPVARAVGRELGIDQVFAGVRPEDKDAKVAELQHDGRVVAMVGDGVNDAPALAQADVGIAIGAGTDVAIASAGVILASSDPRAVLSIIELSHASYRKMQQNLWWAAGYNIAAVPLAAGVLAPVGFVMPMAVGAILMSASTVIVALNAQLLRRIDLDPARLASR
ncbi:Cu2+-exporting ATPase [Cellulosimicrobium cellulans]|uniref:heavy metal translocating P-type ATPase n=1 Tax=Cellulosimicrobium cellulans TaxID=1710 RepID=UPI0035A911B2|nr:Cu2+-exporting ATPase [Cellulosimicrobium cellulans]